MPQAKTNDIPNNINGSTYAAPGKRILLFWVIVGAVIGVIFLILNSQRAGKPLQPSSQIASTQPRPEKVSNGNLPWQESYAAGLALAKRDQKMLMLYFTTDWCGWCRKMEKETFTDRDLALSLNQLVTVKVNGDLDKERTKEFGVTGYPTLVFLDPSNRNVIEKVVGFVPADSLKGKVKSVLSRAEKKEKASPPDPQDKKKIETAANREQVVAEKVVVAKKVEETRPLEVVTRQEPHVNPPLGGSSDKVEPSPGKQEKPAHPVRPLPKAEGATPDRSEYRRCFGPLPTQGRPLNETISGLENASRWNSRDPEIFHQLGHAHWMAKNGSASVRHFERAVNLAPLNAAYYYCSARAFYELGMKQIGNNRGHECLKKALILVNKGDRLRGKPRDFDQLKWKIRKAYSYSVKKTLPMYREEKYIRVDTYYAREGMR